MRKQMCLVSLVAVMLCITVQATPVALSSNTDNASVDVPSVSVLTAQEEVVSSSPEHVAPIDHSALPVMAAGRPAAPYTRSPQASSSRSANLWHYSELLAMVTVMCSLAPSWCGDIQNKI